MGKIGNKELVRLLVEKYEIDHSEAERWVSLFFDVINEGLRRDKQVKVKGLGTFKVTAVASRKSVDVNTGEAIIIEGRDKISFTADKAMADEVNRPFSQFDTVLINDGVSFDEIDQRYAALAQQEAAEASPLLPSPQEEQPTAATTPEAPAEAAPAANDTPAVQVENIEAPKKDGGPLPLTLSATQLSALNATPEPADCANDAAAQPFFNSQSSIFNKQIPSASASSPVNFSLSPQQLRVLNGTPQTVEEEEPLVQAEQPETVAQAMPTATEASEEAQQQLPEAAAVTAPTPLQQPSEPTPEVSADDHHTDLARMREYTATLSEKVDEQQRTMRWALLVAAVLVVACIATLLYMNSQLRLRENRIQHLEARTSQPMPTAAAQATQRAAHNDSLSAAADSADAEQARQLAAEAQAERDRAAALAAATREAQQREEEARRADVQRKEKAQAEAKARQIQQAQAAKEAKATATAAAQYRRDPRIRHGAYNIVGIERTYTVRPGQTLSAIARSTLGRGMECYIEAVNGGRKEYRAGEKIKIPKLKVKKR